MDQKTTNALAIVSMIIGIISLLLSCCYGGVLGIVGLILGIVAIQKENGKGMAITGVATSSVALLITIGVLISGVSMLSELDTADTSEATTTETTTTEEYTTEATTTEEPELTLDEFKSVCEYPSYEDLQRYPDSYQDKRICVTVTIKEYEEASLFKLSLHDTYTATMNGQDIILYDHREVDEPKMLAGDTVYVYGYGNGLATMEEIQTFLGIEVSSEEYYIPSFNFVYAEIVE